MLAELLCCTVFVAVQGEEWASRYHLVVPPVIAISGFYGTYSHRDIVPEDRIFVGTFNKRDKTVYLSKGVQGTQKLYHRCEFLDTSELVCETEEF